MMRVLLIDHPNSSFKEQRGDKLLLTVGLQFHFHESESTSYIK